MKILLLEDDIFWRTEILMLLEDLSYEEIHICKDIQHCSNYLLTNTPDIIIADVILGEQTAFELLSIDKIREIPILFITISDSIQFYEQSKDHPLSLYLIKPFHKISLQACIENLLLMKTQSLTQGEIQKSTKSIIVRGQFQEKIALPIEKILYIRSELAYCIVKTEKAQFALKYSLQKLLHECQPLFIQTHRAFIVNKSIIQKIDLRKKVINTEFGEIPIGRLYKKEVLTFYNTAKFN